ncbi:MAG: PQQ-binding-like beta-propeller repeat protein, partial [Flavobacteriales bacterium]
IALFDVATGKIRWSQIDLFGKGWVAEVMDGKPLETGNASFIVATVGGMSGGGIYCLSEKDGAILWKGELPKVSGAQSSTVTETKLLTSTQESADFYYLKGSNIMAYSKSDGKPVWEKPVKQKGLPDMIAYDPEGLIVGSIIDPKNNIAKPVISMYDYKSGTEKWEKAAKLDGGIKQYKYVDQGLAVAMETGQGNYLINIVDLKTGSFLYEKSAKLKGELREIRSSSKGLFFRTTTEVNILNLASGNNFLEKSIRCGAEQNLLHAWKDQICYIFNPGDNLLYSIDISTGELKNLSGIEIKFEQKEKPSSIEIRENGVLLYSSQNMILYDFIGKELYRKHIPAPGESGWKKAILATSAMINAMDAMQYYELAAAAQSAKQDASTPQGREFCDQIGQFGNSVGNMRMASAAKDMERMKARFKASAGGDNTYFMMTKMTDGTFGLTAISKVNGTSTGEISFGKNKQPRYEVDDISKKLYYLAERGKIMCYSY